MPILALHILPCPVMVQEPPACAPLQQDRILMQGRVDATRMQRIETLHPKLLQARVENLRSKIEEIEVALDRGHESKLYYESARDFVAVHVSRLQSLLTREPQEIPAETKSFLTYAQNIPGVIQKLLPELLRGEDPLPQQEQDELAQIKKALRKIANALRETNKGSSLYYQSMGKALSRQTKVLRCWQDASYQGIALTLFEAESLLVAVQHKMNRLGQEAAIPKSQHGKISTRHAHVAHIVHGPRTGNTVLSASYAQPGFVEIVQSFHELAEIERKIPLSVTPIKLIEAWQQITQLIENLEPLVDEVQDNCEYSDHTQQLLKRAGATRQFIDVLRRNVNFLTAHKPKGPHARQACILLADEGTILGFDEKPDPEQLSIIFNAEGCLLWYDPCYSLTEAQRKVLSTLAK